MVSWSLVKKIGENLGLVKLRLTRKLQSLVDGKALDYRFYTQMRVQKKHKAFAYRVPIGDYNYLQCSLALNHVSVDPDCWNSDSVALLQPREARNPEFFLFTVCSVWNLIKKQNLIFSSKTPKLEILIETCLFFKCHYGHFWIPLSIYLLTQEHYP